MGHVQFLLGVNGLMFCRKGQAMWFGLAWLLVRCKKQSIHGAYCVLLKVGRLSAKPERDVLIQDFAEVETVTFPR